MTLAGDEVALRRSAEAVCQADGTVKKMRTVIRNLDKAPLGFRGGLRLGACFSKCIFPFPAFILRQQP